MGLRAAALNREPLIVARRGAKRRRTGGRGWRRRTSASLRGGCSSRLCLISSLAGGRQRGRRSGGVNIAGLNKWRGRQAARASAAARRLLLSRNVLPIVAGVAALAVEKKNSYISIKTIMAMPLRRTRYYRWWWA